LAELNDLSLREIEQCSTEINLVARTTSPAMRPHVGLLALLVNAKTADASLYEDLANGDATLDALLAYVRPLNDYRYEAVVEAAYMCDFMVERDVDSRLNELDEVAESGHGVEHKHARRVFDHVRNFREGRDLNPIRSIIERLKIATDFSS
jgi:hypothetical protein